MYPSLLQRRCPATRSRRHNSRAATAPEVAVAVTATSYLQARARQGRHSTSMVQDIQVRVRARATVLLSDRHHRCRSLIVVVLSLLIFVVVRMPLSYLYLFIQLLVHSLYLTPPPTYRAQRMIATTLSLTRVTITTTPYLLSVDISKLLCLSLSSFFSFCGFVCLCVYPPPHLPVCIISGVLLAPFGPSARGLLSLLFAN
jgi:hypothetical protein